MPIHPKKRIKLLRIAAAIFALNVIVTLAAGFEAHHEGKKTRMYIVRAVCWAAPCAAFLVIAQKRSKAMQVADNTPPQEPKG